jgi:hypothetical protein
MVAVAGEQWLSTFGPSKVYWGKINVPTGMASLQRRDDLREKKRFLNFCTW